MTVDHCPARGPAGLFQAGSPDEENASEGWRCLEVGAGGGSIAEWLCRRAGATGTAIAVSSSVAGLASATIAGNTVNLTATAPGVSRIPHGRSATVLRLQPGRPVIVASLFPPLLHRTTAPTAAELNGWVNSTSDLLTIEVTMAGSAEFFTNG